MSPNGYPTRFDDHDRRHRNLPLEQLKTLRNDMREFRSQFEQEMDDLKERMSSLENSMLRGGK